MLEKGIAAARALPEERQDMAGELLLAIAGQPHLTLSPEQIEDVKLAIAEADRGEFATDEEMAALWRKCGQ
jgi:predicted transcriptional regulator